MQQTIKLNNFMTLSLSRVQVRARNLRSKIHLDACLQGKRFQKRNHKDSVKNDAMNLATKGGKNVSVRFLTFGLICIANKMKFLVLFHSHAYNKKQCVRRWPSPSCHHHASMTPARALMVARASSLRDGHHAWTAGV